MNDIKYDHVGEPEDRLVEECGEVLQALSKARRFGYLNFHLDRPDSTNMDELRHELDDLTKAIDKLYSHMDRIHELKKCFMGIKGDKYLGTER